MLNFIFFLIHTFCFVLFGFKSIKKVWEWQKESENVVEEMVQNNASLPSGTYFVHCGTQVKKVVVQ